MAPPWTIDELLKLAIDPIRPDSPTGDPGRDEPQYEILQAEIRKLEHPDGIQPAWDVVVDSAGELLGHKSKDLLPACYLCVALLHRDGYAGFAAGLAILKELIDRYWETLYPELKRMRGRTAALEWLVERGCKGIEGRPPRSEEGDALARCKTLIDEIQSELEPKLDTGWQLFLNLQSSLDTATQRAAPEQAPVPERAAAGGPRAAAPSEIRTGDDAVRALGDLKDLARRISEFLRTNEPADPMGYRLLRTACWLSLSGPPPHTNGLTQIPPPQPPDISVRIQTLLDQGKWAGVLEECESRLPTSVLWIDLHRFAVAALEGMGEACLPAAQAIVQELAQLLVRAPGLETLRFQTGQPLADDATRAWIRERVRPAAGARDEEMSADPGSLPGTASAGEADAQEQGKLAQAREEARALAKRKNLQQALRLLESGAEESRTIPWRARWTLEMARVCMESGALQTALAQLSLLDETLQSSRCEDWAPDLCLEVLKSLYLCHQKVLSSVHPAPPADVERARKILGRIGRLDLGAAVSLEGKG